MGAAAGIDRQVRNGGRSHRRHGRFSCRDRRCGKFRHPPVAGFIRINARQNPGGVVVLRRRKQTAASGRWAIEPAVRLRRGGGAGGMQAIPFQHGRVRCRKA
jgi:hypothetical protein